MSTNGNSLACEGMYSKLIDDEGAYDDQNRRPDVGLGGKDSPNNTTSSLWSNCCIFMEELKALAFYSLIVT